MVAEFIATSLLDRREFIAERVEQAMGVFEVEPGLIGEQ
jgi:hypothetical protein